MRGMAAACRSARVPPLDTPRALCRTRFSAHVGDIPTRASFAPHAGRSKKDAMKVEKQRPSTLAAVDEASESGAGGAGAGASTPGGGSTPYVVAGWCGCGALHVCAAVALRVCVCLPACHPATPTR